MQDLNMEAKMEGGKANVRKRGCSSSSPSSSFMASNYRTFLMRKRRGSTTPVPRWKMITSLSHHLSNDGEAFSYLNATDFSVSARKLAAVLWEIDRLPSPRERMDKKCEKGRILEPSKLRSMELALSDPFLTTVSEGILDPTKLCSCRRRALAGCRKLQRPSSNLRTSTSIPSCLGQVDEAQLHGRKNNLKDVYNGLTASKQLLKVLSRVWGVEQHDSTGTTLVSALRAELDRSCDRVSRLIRGQETKKSDIEALLKQIKHSIHNAVPSVLGELETEKKLRRRGEKLNKKTGAELEEAKASLAMAMKEVESEKKARRKVEQVCEELARGIWELKSQFAKVREEVEKEREMFHLADLLREERVQMKLSEAKCLYEEQNAVVDKLRNELAAYLEGGKGGSGSFGHDKSNDVERVLGEKLENQDKESESNAAVNEEESDDSDLESIELSMKGMSNTFVWGNAVENGSKSKELKCSTEEAGKLIISSKMQHRVMKENQEFFARVRFSEPT